MPSGLLLRCLRYPSEKNSLSSNNTTNTSAVPSLEDEKSLLNIPKSTTGSPGKQSESKRDSEPSEKVCNIEEMLSQYPWYHGNIDRLSAEQMVLRQGLSCHGTFLVRQSRTRKGQHVITFNSNARATHMQFQFNSLGQCKMKYLWFETIFDMLEYFRAHEIPVESRSNSDITLTSYVSNLDNNCKLKVDKNAEQ